MINNAINEQLVQEVEGKFSLEPDSRVIVSTVDAATSSLAAHFTSVSLREVARMCAGSLHGLHDEALERAAANRIYYHGWIHAITLDIDLEPAPILVGTVGALANNYIQSLNNAR